MIRINRFVQVLLICTLISTLSPSAMAATRFFIPEFHVGSGADTQLLINNKDERDGTVDVWAFSKSGELFGQAQIGLKALSTRSFTLSELFGGRGGEQTGWLAAFSTSNTSELSYRLIGHESDSEIHEAEIVPSRQAGVDAAPGRVVRLSNPSSEPNTITVRKLGENREFLGLQQLSIGPFSQIELPAGAERLELSGSADFLASLGDRHPETVRQPATSSLKESVMAVEIDSEVALGAFQLVLRFDPESVKFSSDDIQGGTAEGFDTKPLAIGIDNGAGELRIASFQLGNLPIGRADVAHLRMHPLSKSPMRFEIKVEEITDVKGESILKSLPTIRLTRVN